ncbi:hypothetical protein [Treponema sp.]|uniref:hypothetical protein n=1 Tax=Treponema sp. TaxID=166 RepID=UPI0025CF4BD1|nr:hypothetical protein [Treponema sp.]MCR5218451.1 hypothetical protein [Treponema sp.]
MITLICGSMYSGKSTTLLMKIQRAIYGRKKAVLIRAKIDNRGYFTHSLGNEELRQFVENKKLTVLEINEFTEEKVKEICEFFDSIFIDEFFMIKNCALLAKKSLPSNDVYFAGLIATSENQVFSEVIDILPYCDEILKLNGVCMECGSQLGNYSLYTGGTKTQTIEVGDINKYKCVCKECYLKINGKL